ncbi:MULTISPECIES: universal stress protein [Mesobacillus]|uniref:universal stress protein n=1 Tax=Mesobacillus TaxID=2675231 RepID=UPI001786142E|nr:MULTISPECIES: universal stress protein [Mesobacillus]MCM3573403.1 universal stress protein [Mesobacillus subterraneus]UYZ23058.1 universal stress protein [Mesobacillus jeotgali]
MAGIKKVVLAYDDSEGSKKALQLAKEFTIEKDGVKLYVGHVYEEEVKSELVETTERPIEHLPINNFPADGIQVPPLAMEQGALDKSEHSIITHSSEQAFNNAKAELDALHIDTEYSILEGSPSESIVEYAKDVEADLIIIGQSGKEGIKRKLLGGVSQKVANNAHCHVLIAK